MTVAEVLLAVWSWLNSPVPWWAHFVLLSYGAYLMNQRINNHIHEE